MGVRVMKADPFAGLRQRRAASQQPDQLAALSKAGGTASRPEDLLQFKQLAAFEVRKIKSTWHALTVARHAFSL
jgi:hypothetical protein